MAQRPFYFCLADGTGSFELPSELLQLSPPSSLPDLAEKLEEGGENGMGVEMYGIPMDKVSIEQETQSQSEQRALSSGGRKAGKKRHVSPRLLGSDSKEKRKRNEYSSEILEEVKTFTLSQFSSHLPAKSLKYSLSNGRTIAKERSAAKLLQ